MTKGEEKIEKTAKQQEGKGQEKAETNKLQSTCSQIPQQ